MRYLTLMRHAKSDWSAHTADHDRPLNSRGQDDAARMARVLSRAIPTPQCIVASTARRVQETLTVFRDSWSSSPWPIWESHEELYLPEAETIWDHVAPELERFDEVWLVAHNPGIADAIGMCTRTQLRDVPTLAVARIGFHPDQINPGAGSLLLFSCPKAFSLES